MENLELFILGCIVFVVGIVVAINTKPIYSAIVFVCSSCIFLTGLILTLIKLI